MPRSRSFPVLLLLAASTALSAQTYTVLYNFGSKAGDPTGARNSGIVAQSRGGNLFSSTDDHWTDQKGAAYYITPGGTLTVVHRFSVAGGLHPVGGLTLGAGGLYYGANKDKGLYGFGNIFKMTRVGGVTILHQFDSVDNASGCSHPVAPPIQSVGGGYYGTAIGDGPNNGCVYRISASGQFTVLHTFNATDGRRPMAPLVQGSDFKFYGTTQNGGWSGYGTLFRVSSNGDFEWLYTFDGTNAFPTGPMIEGNDGNFYGTATFNGVFKMTPAGVVTVLYEFPWVVDHGWLPIGGVVQASDGNFYGTTQRGGAFDAGALYRVTPAGDFTDLHDFEPNTGTSAENTLMQHTNGILYGTTDAGGSGNKGTFFSMDLGLPPFVSYLPVYGQVGTQVQILGQGFTADTVVSFNGTPATSVVVEYPTYLQAIVPVGATTGPITATTSTGTLTSNKVFVIHP